MTQIYFSSFQLLSETMSLENIEFSCYIHSTVIKQQSWVICSIKYLNKAACTMMINLQTVTITLTPLKLYSLYHYSYKFHVWQHPSLVLIGSSEFYQNAIIASSAG